MEKSALFCCAVPVWLQPWAYEAGVECLYAAGFEPLYMVMRGVSAHDYTLIQAAKALMCGGLGLTIYDLADRDVVDDEAFWLIVNALLIANYGSDVLKLGGTELEY